jgi:hypothetical protein
MSTIILRTIVSAIIGGGLVSFFGVMLPDILRDRRRARWQAEYRAKQNHPSNYR